MSMDGSRFGLGLVVGVLAAAAIVGVAGAPTFSQILHAPVSGQGTSNSATSTTHTSAASVTASVSNPGSNNGSSYTAEVTSTGSGMGVTQNPQTFFGVNLPSPQVAAVGSQSPTSNAFLIVPVLVALAFGVALYRASVGARDEPENESG